MTQEGPPGGSMAGEGSRAGGGGPGGAAHAAARGQRGGGLVPERSDRQAQDLRQRSRRARRPFLASLAGGPAPNEWSLRHARRLVSAGRRVRLARALPAVLRAARPRDLSGGRAEAAARFLE